MISFVARKSTWVPPLAGALIGLSGSPWNQWWLALIGLSLWAWAVDQCGKRQRFTQGFGVAFWMFVISLFWMRQFSLPGVIVLSAFEAVIVSIGMVVVSPKSKLRLLAFPSVLFLAELFRIHWPFGGFPMGGLSLGQAEGPFLFAARIVGEPGVVFIVALFGVAAYELCRRRSSLPVAALAAVTAVAIGGWLAPVHESGSMNIAAVQGGGKQGLKLPDQRPDRVFADQRTQSAFVSDPVDLIVWPENTVAVDNSIDDTAYQSLISQIAQQHNAFVAAGVVEYVGDRFHNAEVVWNANGNMSERYEKLHPVPFGEYVPGRELIEKIGKVSAVPRDVFPGRGNGVVSVKDHPVGVAISFEGFFSRHARSVVRNNAEVLIIPTNAASYKSKQVPIAQISAARFRAVETGRWVVQAAPTGMSAIINEHGDVLRRSSMGNPAVLQADVALSKSTTPFVLLGNLPLLALSIATLLAIAMLRFRSPRRLDTHERQTARVGPPDR